MSSHYEPILLFLLALTGYQILAWRGRKTVVPTDDSVNRNLRGLGVAVVAFTFSSWLTLAVAFSATDRPLPVKPPGTVSSCGSSSHGDALFVIIIVVVLVVLRFGPALIGFLVGRRKAGANRPLPHGRGLLFLGAALAGVSLLTVVVRLIMGGVSPKAFTTYGALTPPGAKGWRVERVIDRHLAAGARWETIEPGPSLPSDEQRIHSHMPLSAGPHEVPGLKAWIAGEPVNIIFENDRFLAQPVVESTVDEARRPHFDTAPKIAAARKKNGSSPDSRSSDYYLIKASQKDGAILAVRVSVSASSPDVNLEGVDRQDVGLLLQPPLSPLLISLVLMALALGLWRVSQRLGDREPAGSKTWAAISRLGGAGLLFEASLILLGAYRIYF